MLVVLNFLNSLVFQLLIKFVTIYLLRILFFKATFWWGTRNFWVGQPLEYTFTEEGVGYIEIHNSAKYTYGIISMNMYCDPANLQVSGYNLINAMQQIGISGKLPFNVCMAVKAANYLCGMNVHIFPNKCRAQFIQLQLYI